MVQACHEGLGPIGTDGHWHLTLKHKYVHQSYAKVILVKYDNEIKVL